MLKRTEVYKRTEKELKDHALAKWAFNSHNWNETTLGYFICLWCGARHISTQGINREFPLCRNNPIMKKFRKDMFDEMRNMNIYRKINFLRRI